MQYPVWAESAIKSNLWAPERVGGDPGTWPELIFNKITCPVMEIESDLVISIQPRVAQPAGALEVGCEEMERDWGNEEEMERE